jgi:hypothetical protein
MKSMNVLAAALVALALLPSTALACYCDETPFREEAARADLVFIGVVTETRTWLNTDKDACCEGRVSWSATVAVDRFVKGYASPTPLVVGGGSTSCDVDASVLHVGELYAFAVDTMQDSRRRYRISACRRSWAAIRQPDRPGDASIAEVEAFARAESKN